MAHQTPVLQKIIDQAEDLSGQGKPVLAVFDLDSTLFDVGPRLEKILIEFSEIPENQKDFPDQVKHFKNIRIERRDWGIKDSLIRAGLDGHHPEFQEKVRDYWKRTFFSNEYLHYDKPYPGATKFVQALAETGVHIVYLTGRDVHRMGQGSHDVLLKWKFPLDEKKSRLVLKPYKEMDDSLFKCDWFKKLHPEEYTKIWFFENEPVNINLIRKECPAVEIIFFDSTHSRQQQAPEDIPAIMHFLLDEQ